MTTKSDRFDLSGNPYDISATVIQTRADMAGAQVFVIEGRIGKLRVLDFSEREAVETYAAEVQDQDPECRDCGWLESECKCALIKALQDEADEIEEDAKDLRKQAENLARPR